MLYYTYMKIRLANSDEVARWNELLVKNPDGGNVLQMKEVAELKRARGWVPRYLIVDDYAITIHEHSIPFLGKIWYLIKGPGLTVEREITEVMQCITDFARTKGVFLVKIEPELPKNAALDVAFKQNGYIPATALQPNVNTVTLDLSGSLDDVLMSLNQKGRHAIRRGERDGVDARQVEYSKENSRKMYDLLTETASGKFRVRSYEYYDAFWRSFIESGYGALFFAHHEGRLVAAAFAIYLGEKSCYKDGASTRNRTAYGASHILQWRVIEWAKQKGATLHDLCGAPSRENSKDESHPYYGMGRFKMSFNKEITEYIGAYDIAIRPLQYKIWSKIGERIKVRLYSKIHHEYWY